MKLKANLHFHAAEDPHHNLDYTIKDGVDRFVSLGFNVLAVTCHGVCVCTTGDIEYAKSKGMLLIPGIEANIYNHKTSKTLSHVVILNSPKSAETVRTFSDLIKFKKEHPEIFILAPHPYFHRTLSLFDNLEKYIDLFDAIELSWFYSYFFNLNKKAEKVAKKHNKPYIATSDTHFFDFINTNYVTVEAKEQTAVSFFDAIKKHDYKNTTSPRKLLTELFPKSLWFLLNDKPSN